MDVTEFRTRRTIGVDPAPGLVLLNAPRPLYGDEVVCDLRGFTVAAPDNPEHLVANFRLDATRIVFVTRADAIAETRARITRDYPDVDLSDFDDDTLAAMWSETER